MREAAIISTARTPIGKAYRGAFNATEAPPLVPMPSTLRLIGPASILNASTISSSAAAINGVRKAVILAG